MNEKQRNNRWIMMMQCLVWLCVIILPPLATKSAAGKYGEIPGAMLHSLQKSLWMICIYFVNYLVLVPRLLFVEERKKWFYIANVAIDAGILLSFISMLLAATAPDEVRSALTNAGVSMTGAVIGICIALSIFYVILVLIAVGMRYIARWNEQQIRLKEEEKQKTQAELTWLRHQLNPHFLFNAMNNISSLTQIDPDRAQEELGRLSDVLRYSLYDAERQEVPLQGEIEFMKEYVALMQLRCNSLATVTMQFDVPDPAGIMIAPLLFISLIENAFKHGISARQESFVAMKMYAQGRDLVFECRNSRFEKAGEDRIGSGIGIENLRHRLELLYPGRHSFTTNSTEGEYSAILTIKNLIING